MQGDAARRAQEAERIRQMEAEAAAVRQQAQQAAALQAQQQQLARDQQAAAVAHQQHVRHAVSRAYSWLPACIPPVLTLSTHTGNASM